MRDRNITVGGYDSSHVLCHAEFQCHLLPVPRTPLSPIATSPGGTRTRAPGGRAGFRPSRVAAGCQHPLQPSPPAAPKAARGLGAPRHHARRANGSLRARFSSLFTLRICRPRSKSASTAPIKTRVKRGRLSPGNPLLPAQPFPGRQRAVPLLPRPGTRAGSWGVGYLRAARGATRWEESWRLDYHLSFC